MTFFGKCNRIARKHMGEFFINDDNEVGEAVHWWGWGGVDLLFPNGNIVTYAMGDVSETDAPAPTREAIAVWEFDEFGGAVKAGEADAN